MFTFIIRYAEKADSTCNDIVEDIVVIDIGNSSIFEGSFCKEHLGNCWEVTYSLHFEECAKREMFVSLLDCFDTMYPMMILEMYYAQDSIVDDGAGGDEDDGI